MHGRKEEELKNLLQLAKGFLQPNSGQDEGQRGDVTELKTLLGHSGGIAPYLLEPNEKATPSSRHVSQGKNNSSDNWQRPHPSFPGTVLPCLQLPLASSSTAQRG